LHGGDAIFAATLAPIVNCDLVPLEKMDFWRTAVKPPTRTLASAGQRIEAALDLTFPAIRVD
jgi:hypothetical protein